ncbi:MAG: LamG-like jellyroll fold domain-containing protein [Bacteroidota bacterium]
MTGKFTLHSLWGCVLFVAAGHLSAQNINFSDPLFISKNSAEVDVADLDADGFNDILICGDQQVWYKGPDFTEAYEIGQSDGGPYAARVADMNGDGWPDFVTSDGARNEGDYPGHVYLYLHPGNTTDVFLPWQRIVVYSGNVRHQNDLRLVDIDGDGKLDILEKTWSSTERVLMAFQNDNINNWTVRTFETGENGKPEGISAGDLDGDGQVEIVQSGVYWDCTGNWRTDAFDEFSIDPEFYANNFHKTKSETGDIDNDGDIDVYIGSAEGNDLKLSWYENEGLNPDGSVSWTEHLIRDDFGKCHMVRLFDIDLDGDLDLCTGRSFGSNGLLIFYNENNGDSWTMQDYDPDGEIYTGAVADLDADGDFDVVGPTRFYGGSTRYYINETPGDPPADPANLDATLIDGIYADLSWEDLSDNEGSFQIERQTDGGPWETLISRPANTTSYLDQMTFPDETYRYRIRAANAAGASDWIVSNEVTVDGNFPPDANAGPNQTFFSLQSVELDGRASFDLDDPIDSLTFSWDQVEGPSVSISHADSIVANFTPSELGVYTFELIVRDEMLSDTDLVVIRFTDLDANLLAYWPMEAYTGDTVPELVAEYTSLRNIGTEWRSEEGVSGDALFFDGNTSRVDVEAFDVSGEAMTITCWIKAADLDNVEGRIISKASSTSGTDHYWMLSQNAGSQLRFRLKTDQGGTATLISQSDEIIANQWYFIAARYDGVNMELYKDGQLIASLAKTGLISEAPSVPISIGNQPTGAGERPFSGWIDDVRIYDIALSQSDIEQLFNPISLPVSWLIFEAEVRNKQAWLDWRVGSEYDNEGFWIERLQGPNGIFEPIGFVPGRGNTNEARDYTFRDVSPLLGRNTYRLKQIDFDGSFDYSDIQTLFWREETQAVLFPNPAVDWLFGQGIETGTPWTIVDANGRNLKAGIWDEGGLQIRDLSAGSYWLRIHDKSYPFRKR